ncbi:hypothetical protein V1525DRAFT_394578 [Lipomyces kononenkoae]|uniref:Uncharacterized protein n=1 Tax=Lipomyces kononenkoae TaxID=34357 RepID=A0ACC3T9Q5_LIPKO
MSATGMRVFVFVYCCIALILCATCVSAVNVTYEIHTLSNGTVIYVADRSSMRPIMRANKPETMHILYEAIRNMTIVDRDRVLNGLPRIYSVIGTATYAVPRPTVVASTITSVLPTIPANVVEQNDMSIARRPNQSWIQGFNYIEFSKLV